MGTLEENVQMLMDRAQINELVVGYSRSLDERDGKALENLFTDDGSINMPFGRFEKAEMADKVVNIQDKWYESAQHFLGNIGIKVDGDTAVARYYLRLGAVVVPAAAEDDTNRADIAGWYLSNCRRTPEGWKIVDTTFTMMWAKGLRMDV